MIILAFWIVVFAFLGWIALPYIVWGIAAGFVILREIFKFVKEILFQ